MWVIRAQIHKIFSRIANSEDPDKTASEEAVLSGSALFVKKQSYLVLHCLPVPNWLATFRTFTGEVV